MEHKIMQAISGLVSIVAGVFLLVNTWVLTTTELFIIGIGSVLLGVILAGMVKRSWYAVFGLILFGVYQIMRAAGAIEYPILKYIISVLVIGLGIFLVIRLFINQSVDTK